MGWQLDGVDDSILDEIEDKNCAVDPVEDPEIVQDVNKEQVTPLIIANTNARSLCPKIASLIDCYEELDITLGIVTETWLASGESLDQDIRDLAAGAGLDMICLNRDRNGRGIAHGGVTVIASTCSLKKLDVPNPENFEVLATLSTLPGYSRKLLTVACYLPPNYPWARGREALDHIEDVVREPKKTYRDPFMVVGGDFNQWSIGEALSDLRGGDVGPTRKDRCIDRLL